MIESWMTEAWYENHENYLTIKTDEDRATSWDISDKGWAGDQR